MLYGDGLPTIGNGYTWQPAVFLADGTAVSEQKLPSRTGDSAGFTPRHSWVWASVTYQGQLNALNPNAYTPDGNLAGGRPRAHDDRVGDPAGHPAPVSVRGADHRATGQQPPRERGRPCVAGHPRERVPGGHEHVHERRHQHLRCFTGVEWYDAAGNYLSFTGIGGAIPQNFWTPVSSWNTAPTSAATGKPFGEIEASAGGNVSSTVTTCFAGIAVVNPVAPSPQASWAGPLTSAAMNGPGGRAGSDVPEQPAGVPGRRGADHLHRERDGHPGDVPDQRMAAPGIDTYNAYLASGFGYYNVPVSGLYLAFACFPFAANSTGSRYAGFQVTSATSAATSITNFAGPAYAAVTAAAPTSACAFRVLDLRNTDTVAPLAYQSSGGSLALTDGAPGYASRFGMLYLSNLSAGGVSSLTPPVTSFHWYAGIPPASLLGYMNEHLGNDLAFLISRPYFTGYQATAQPGLANGSWNAVTIDTVKGLVHGSAGDNFGGWNSTKNAYYAQVPGWYMCMAEVYASLPSAATGFISAGFNVPSSGGIAPSAAPDVYQVMFYPQT